MSRAELVRADELTSPPAVGQRYLVPVVRGYWSGVMKDWPVMGPKHEDADLKFPWRHYHIDARFVGPKQATVMRRAYRFTAGAAAFPSDAALFAAASAPLMERSEPDRAGWYSTANVELPSPVWRSLICRRVQHEYPLAYSLKNPPHAQLHERYAGHRCARNASGLLVCPHKGFVLSSLVPDADGRVTCPLHGLVVDIRAGAVVEPQSIAPLAGAA